VGSSNVTSQLIHVPFDSNICRVGVRWIREHFKKLCGKWCSFLQDEVLISVGDAVLEIILAFEAFSVVKVNFRVPM